MVSLGIELQCCYSYSVGDRLAFTVGSSLQPFPVDLFCNHPLNSDDVHQRKKFTKLTWSNPFDCKADDGDRVTHIDLSCSGTFCFYLIKGTEQVCQGYFVVEPSLNVGSGSLPLDSIIMQTVLTKSLGLFTDWEKRLEVARECGYNMIHFTPMQELGQSQSSYSIQSQLDINSAFSSSSVSATFDNVHALIKKMQMEWNVLSLTDVVWNHTANSTKWILEHPEACYNLVNSAHLRPAFILDRALWHFNREIASGKWEIEGLPSVISEEYHLERVAHIYW